MLRSVSKGVWQATQTLRFPGGVRLPANMTVLQDDDAKLTLVSPIRIDGALAAEISALGDVVAIVAPNTFHHLFIKSAQEHFPHASLVGPEGLHHKRKDLSFANASQHGVAPWSKDITLLALRGAPKMSEFEVFHAPSSTLVTTDLFFHIREPETFATKMVLTLNGTKGRFGLSRLWRFYISEREQARESVKHMLALAPQTVVVAHGDPKTMAPGELETIFDWLGPNAK